MWVGQEAMNTIFILLKFELKDRLDFTQVEIVTSEWTFRLGWIQVGVDMSCAQFVCTFYTAFTHFLFKSLTVFRAVIRVGVLPRSFKILIQVLCKKSARIHMSR